MHALRVQSLFKRFGRTEVLRDLSFSVERGAVYGLLGPNGSGKTTTLSCALGLLAPDRGSVDVLGVPAARLYATGGKVACVFDDATLVPALTVEENLHYARRAGALRGGLTPKEALERCGLTHLARRRARALSLGQSRRTSIARALLGDPELFVLDEPLAGLDTRGVRDTLQLLRDLNGEGRTLVLSSHRMHELERVVSHVGVILDGRVVREGPLDVVLGGEEDLHELRVEPADRARAVLEAAGFAVIGEGPDGLVVRGSNPGALNRTLVEAGVEVSALAPRRRTLQAVFEELLDGQLENRAS